MHADRELFQNTLKFGIISKYNYVYRHSQKETKNYGKILLLTKE